MPLDKPTTVPRWAETPGRRLEPTETRKDSGWYISDYPPAEEFNWINGLSGDWLKWIDERLGQDALDPSVFALLNPVNATLQLQTIPAGGIKIGHGLNVGFDGASLVGSVCVGDSAFCMLYGGGSPMLQFDAAADSMRFDRAANVFSWFVGSAERLSVGAAGLRIGVGSGAPSFPFHVTEQAVGELGSLLGDVRTVFSLDYLSGDTVDLLAYARREQPGGTTWTTVSTYIHFGAEAGSERHGFVRFSGSDVASTDYGILSHVGIGSGDIGSGPSLYVDSQNVYVHKLMPRSVYGGSSLVSVLGSSIRPWGELWMRDDTGRGAHVNATGSGGPGVLTFESFDGAVSRGFVKLVGSAAPNGSRLDCIGVGYVDTRYVRARTGDPQLAAGFVFTDSLGVSLVSGMCGSADGTAVRFWRNEFRAAEFAGRAGNGSDVQLTLGRGTGAGASVADLRDFACLCQDFLAQDSTGGPLVLGDLVTVTSAADHAVTRTYAIGQTNAIGVVVDASITNGAVGRIATSGIVLARTAGSGVTRGDFIQASATAGRVQATGGMSSSVVGFALQTVGSNSYFRMKLRLGN